eukprot:GHVO01052964.1.p1 GENE.GHVO01052964.1~~GHVO01052964.1.p1  ORF type:complete len:344 (+),score=66.60 GHVO01052964.1:32-1063(+)
MESPPPTQPECVKVSLLTLLKLIKYCKDAVPNTVTGHLLGLKTDTGIQVTDCYTVPTIVAPPVSHYYAARAMDVAVAAREEKVETERYSQRVADVLAQTGVESQRLGIFRTLLPNFLKGSDVIDHMVTMINENPHTILIGYDPTVTPAPWNQFGICAYRLSNEFVRLKTKADSTGAEALNTMQGGSVLETVPIQVTCSSLSRKFLLTHASSNNAEIGRSCFDPLGMTKTAQLKATLETLCDSLDEIPTQFDRMVRYQKDLRSSAAAMRLKQEERRMENDARKLTGEDVLPQLESVKVDFPSQVPLLAMSGQVSEAAARIEWAAKDSEIKSKRYQQVEECTNST